MAVTRIKNNQITDNSVTGAKLATNTITAGLLEDNLTYGSNLTVSGNLTVNGTTTTVDTTNTLIADPLFVLSRGETGTPSADSGFVVERGTSTNVAFIWDESAGVFAAVNTTEDGGTAGDITISSYASARLAGITAESATIDNIQIDGNTIVSTDSNGDINLTPDGTGQVVASTFVASDLTSGRVVLAGTSGVLEDNSNLTFNGSTLAVTGATTISTTLGVTGESTLASATISDLTSGRVVLAGTSGAVEDSGNLTFDGSTLTVTGDVSASGDLGGATATVSGNATVGGTLGVTGATTLSSTLGVTGATTLSSTLGVTGEATLASATVSDLTSGRVVLAGTSGAVEDSGNLTFDGTDLTVSSAVVSDLTSGRVVLAGTSGAIEDSTNLTFDGSTLTVTGDVSASGDLGGATATVSGNATVGGTLGVTGESTLASATVSDLTSGRVVLAGTAGAIEDSGNLTFDGSTLAVTGATTISTTLGVTGETTLASAIISDLTSGRILTAGTSGAVEDTADLTMDGTTFGVGSTGEFTVDVATGNTDVSGTLSVDGNVTLALAIDVTGLASLDGGIDVDSAFTVANTTGNVSTSGTLAAGNTTITGTIDTSGLASLDGGIDVDGAFTVANTTGNISTSGTLGVTGESTLASATVSDLTDNRIVVAGTSGSLEDDANLTWDGTAMGVTGGVDITGDLDIDNINIDGNVIASTNSNGDINITPNGTGSTNIKNLTLDGLTADRVLITNSSGGTSTSDNLSFDGTDLDLTGALTVDNITVDGDTISSVHSEITIDPSTAGAGGTVTIAGNLNVTGTTTTVDSTVVTIADPLFQLGADSDDALDRGITALYNDGASKTAFFGMDDSALEFVFIPDATDTSSVISGSLGSAAFGSMRVTDLTSGRIVTAGSNGELQDAAGLAWDGTTLEATALEVDNVQIDGNTITTTAGNLLLDSFGNDVVIDSAVVSDLTSGRVVLAGTSGAIEDSTNLTFDGSTLTVTGDVSASGDLGGATATVTGNATVGGTLGVTGATTLSSTLGVTGESTLASAIVSDLTSGRVVLAGTSGAIEDSGNLTFDGSTLTVTGDVAASGDVAGATATVSGNATVGGTLGVTGATTLSSTLGVTGEATLASATVSDLTSGRVTLAGTSGALEDSGNLTFDGSTLTVTGDVSASGDLGGATATVSGNATVGGTLGVTGATTLSSTLDVTGNTNLNSTTGSTSTTSGALVVDGGVGIAENLYIGGDTNITGGLETATANIGAGDIIIDGITLDVTIPLRIEGDINFNVTNSSDTEVFAVAGATGNTTVGGTLGVTGEATLASATVSDLTSGRVVLAGTAGAIEDSTNLTFDGSTLAVTGAATVSSTLGVTGEATLASATVSDLTADRVVLAGTSGAIEDSANLTFDGSTLAVTGAATVSSTLGVTGESTLASATVSDLTSGRVVLAGTSGAIEDSTNLTFDGTSLGVTGDIVVDNITLDGNSITSSDALTLDAAATQSIVINEAGADVDVRIEASGQANALFIEGSTGNIGFRTATPTAGAAFTVNDTGSIIIPNGTTAQRPGTPAAAMMRFNSSTAQLEFYNGSEWVIAGAEFTIITADSFDGDGSTVAFTLSENATSAGLMVAINGVLQDPGTAYSVSGSTLTFTEAPADNDNIDARIITTTATVTELADSTTSIVLDGAADTITINNGDLDLNGNDLINAGNIVATEAAILSTARNIGGVSFDGSADIDLPGVNTSGNQDTSGNAATATALETARTIGGVSFDGSANINLPGVNATGNQDTSGNAATATALETARTIGGVSFDGSANINLPGVNATGNQDTSGNAATATALATSRTIGLSGDVSGSGSFDGTGNLTISATIADDSHNHTIANIDGLQTALDDKAALSGPTFTGNVAGDNLTLSGNLTVNGTTTTLNTTNTVVSDNLIELNNGVSSNSNDSGIVIERGSTGNNAFMGWDESADKFIVGTTTATGASTGNLAITKGTLLANVEGNVTGNAGTATTLATARTIGGVSFDGSANINLPGVNTAGNQNTSGNAATATTATNVTVSANNTANETVYLTFVDGATGAQGLETDTGLSYNPSTNVLSTTASQAQYADLAEKYTSDADYAPGTVVSFGGTAEVTVNDVDMDRKVAGVVSTDPAYLMNSMLSSQHSVDIALQGRVPCKVTGAVEKGDLMVAAGNGFARAEADPKVGSVIGKALEAHTGGTGIIEVAVGRL